jgi:hypothetical protein
VKSYLRVALKVGELRMIARSTSGATLYVIDGPVTYYIAGIQDEEAPSAGELETVGQQAIG